MPLPTMIATGVARPRAQGQEMTRTVMARSSEKATFCPANSQQMKTSVAMAITAGTNTPDTRSAMRAIGALVAAASETI